MRVVSNTSPISNLAIIGGLELLKRRYGEVRIPAVVERKLSALSHSGGRSEIQTALSAGWLLIDPSARQLTQALPFPLDSGETAAIGLAMALRADVLLIDEKRGRAAARALGLAAGGVLGELLHAKQQGWIPSLRDEIQRLRKEAGFFVDGEIESFILSQARE